MTRLTELFSLSGLNALVVGGSSGIGREIALGFGSAGARVAVVGRDTGKLDAVRSALRAQGNADGTTYSADMRSVAGIGRLAASIERDLGVVDVLVNCQGTTVIKPALEVTEDEYDLVLDTNLKSLFFSCQEFGRRMVARKSGVIINIASLAAHNGWAMAAAYSCSKYGVVALTKSLAAEWGRSGVRVNAISPGFFLTDLNRDKMPEARKAEAIRRNAMGRMGELPELVGAAIYLASPSARFVTGAVLQVDGGYLASGI
jgi:gluconate 5-dehydrogenase